MIRADRVILALETAQRVGRVRSWYAYAPGDRRGRRWVVELADVGTRSYSTREVEALCDALALEAACA